MQVCYLILAHNNIAHLLNIINALYSNNSTFVVHIDKKYNLSKSEISSLKERKVKLVDNRVDVSWGDISVVDAVIETINHALKNVRAESYCLISGADYPMKTKSYIHDYLSNNQNKNFVIAKEIPSKNISWLEGGRRRLEGYVINLNSRNNATIIPREFFALGNLKQLVKICMINIYKLPEALNHLFSSPKRVTPYYMKMYGGEMWWILTHSSLSKIMSFLDDHPNYYLFHKDTQIPDEIFFNTLIANLCENQCNDIKRYIKWGSGNNSSPDWITMKDVEIIDACLKNENILFARKIKDKDVVEYINTKLNR